MDEISAAQAAALTGYSERTIRRKIASGELPARRIAPNRFAIDVRDLPWRQETHDLASRLEALERRVTQLEAGQRALPLAFPRDATEPGDAGDPGAVLAGSEESAAASGMLSQLLVQLLRDVERLDPLLAPEVPGARDEPGEVRRSRDARQRERAAGTWPRPSPEDTAG